MTTRLLGVAGSLRAGSHNRRLLEDLAAAAPPDLDLAVFEGLGEVPLYNEDVEAGGVPSGVRALADAVATADAVVFATPEYNQAIPGVIKNAIDWLSRPAVGAPLRGKAVAVTGATTGLWGTRLAQTQLRGTLVACGAWLLPTPVLFAARVEYEGWIDPAVRAFIEAITTDLKRLGGQSE